MNKRIKISAIATFAALAASLFLSCLSTGKATTPDDKAVDRGTAAWNSRTPAAARSSWTAIKDADLRSRQLGYISSYDAAAKALADAEAAPPSNEDRILASYQKAQKSFASLPDELALPKTVRARGTALAEARMRKQIDAQRFAAAKDLGKAAKDTFGGSAAIDSMLAETEVILASRVSQSAAESTLQGARATEDFDEKITAFEKAAKTYASAEAALSTDAARLKASDSPGVVAEASRLKRKRQEAALEKERLLRERAYSFKDRIGEEFARVPEGNLGQMSLADILKHQESVKAGVEAAYAEMTSFAARYPSVIDKELIADVEAQKKALDEKIAQVNQEIRTAKDIASRGKTVMPILIGLFNPQPGSTEEAKKSRPAVFRATGAKGSEYWWGMVSIVPGAMNDVVVTMKDGRAVRVFGENTLSGSLIAKKGLKDLVNRSYKVGNSWPVLNAGSQLPTGKYFFEVQEGKDSSYEGEVVVYSSFIMRMR